VDWVDGILNKPDGYRPMYHLQLLNSVVGWENVIIAIERLGHALCLQHVPAFDALIDWVEAKVLETVSEEEIRNARIGYGIEEAWEGVHVSGTKDNAYYYSSYHIKDESKASDNKNKGYRLLVLITQSMKEVNQIMSAYVGIVRSDLRLKRAWDRLDIIYEETESLFKRSLVSKEICELRNVINVGYLIMRQAIERKESRGLHYTIDYPHAKK
jgi:L-aspartate oxidase